MNTVVRRVVRHSLGGSTSSENTVLVIFGLLVHGGCNLSNCPRVHSVLQDCSKSFTLVEMLSRTPDFSQKHPAMLLLMRKDYSYTHIHHCL